MIFLILFILSFAAWVFVMIHDRRTSCSGFLLLLSAFLLGVFLISLAQSDPEWFSQHFIIHILLDLELVFLALLLIAYPLVLIPVFLIEGIVLIKKEGIRPRNVLSVGLAILLLAFDLFYPLLFDVSERSLSTIIYWYVTMISLYFVIQLASFSLSGLLNLIHFRKNPGLDHVVVLGAGLSGTKPTPLLRSRIEKGIEVYRNNPGSRLIFSGGQGKDELISEARAMSDYAISQGVPERDILAEDRSRNTDENIRFSAEVMKKDMPGRISSFAIVTSSYHLMRALMIAKRNKLRCTGYGAKTRLYFTLNAFLREYAGYFRDTRYIRLLHLLCLTVIYIIFAASQLK